MWTTDSLLGNDQQTQTFIANCKQYNIGNVFLYMSPSYYSQQAQLQTLLGALNANQINPWGLDGARFYLSDEQGPAKLLNGIDNLVAYNKQVPKNQQFFGFQTDIEFETPTGQQPTFHDKLGDAQLSTTDGGVWKATAAQDRQALGADWLNTHDLIKSKLSAIGVALGAAIPYWYDDYYGSPINTTYKGVDQDLFRHISNIVDQVHIMSYNTDPSYIVDRVSNKLQYLSSLNVKSCASVEAGKDEVDVSYASTTGKDNKLAMITDIGVLASKLSQYSAFNGICIHDYDGFVALTGNVDLAAVTTLEGGQVAATGQQAVSALVNAPVSAPVNAPVSAPVSAPAVGTLTNNVQMESVATATSGTGASATETTGLKRHRHHRRQHK